MWALALSLAAHAVVIFWAQGIKVGSADTPEPKHIIVLDQPHPKPPPPPLAIVTPKPIAFVRPTAPAQHHPPAPPIISHRSGTPGAHVVGPITPPGPIGPDPGPTGAVEPTSAPAPACTAPDIAARAIDPVTPDTPEIAQEQGLTGTTQIRVSIDANGAVTDVGIYRSSGSSLLDAAALHAARESTYKADIRNCEAVSGSYLFTATFQ